jgi:retron-type reverse transcriptase
LNENLITDHTAVSNIFNNFFSTIHNKLLSKAIPPKRVFSDFLNIPNAKSFFINPVTENEISGLITNKLKTEKSLGPNSVPTFLLKLVPHIISKPLCTVINNSFKSGIFPDIFKVAKVIPIFKKGSLLDFTNYRPISLLSNIGKLFEKAMHIRLYAFLEKFKCFYTHQYGFRANHSTTHALIEMTELIRKAIDDKYFACGVFVDLQKAFDTVDHSILLKKLEYYGIRGVPLKWFISYLNNRTQFVAINDSKSTLVKCSNGVPQGSVLGPLLFLLYINDLHTSIKFATVYHFADDTNLMLINKSLKKINKHINHDLANLVQWLRSNKLFLNSNKTELIIFKSNKTKIYKHMNFRLSGKKIEPVNSIKYLGIKIDSNLSFLSQCKDLAMKLSRSNSMFAKFAIILILRHS